VCNRRSPGPGAALACRIENLQACLSTKVYICIEYTHVAATLNTLVLAYTSASLLLSFTSTRGQRQFSDFMNSEVLPEEVVRP
jgi:hypothetical protein